MRLTNINEKESEHEEIRPYWGEQVLNQPLSITKRLPPRLEKNGEISLSDDREPECF